MPFSFNFVQIRNFSFLLSSNLFLSDTWLFCSDILTAMNYFSLPFVKFEFPTSRFSCFGVQLLPKNVLRPMHFCKTACSYFHRNYSIPQNSLNYSPRLQEPHLLFPKISTKQKGGGFIHSFFSVPYHSSSNCESQLLYNNRIRNWYVM